MPHDPTSAPPSDEELACRAQQGCAAAFEQLARRFQVPLLHFLGRRTATAADAEDLAQDTLVRAYQRLGRYRAPLRFSTWLFTIAHRLSINRRRQRQPAANPEALESAAAAVSGCADVVCYNGRAGPFFRGGQIVLSGGPGRLA